MDREIDCFIDRFEGETAVLIAGRDQILVPVRYLPDGAAEGDHLSLSFRMDPRMREKTGDEIARLQDRLSGEEGDRHPGTGSDNREGNSEKS